MMQNNWVTLCGGESTIIMQILKAKAERAISEVSKSDSVHPF